ncbi:MAG: DNA gyrase inhibitor YacG [Vicinamibacterales bacterium]
MPDEPVCVHCRRAPADPAWRPFCSERCRLADLGKWLSGDYRVAGDPLAPDSEADDDDEGMQD